MSRKVSSIFISFVMFGFLALLVPTHAQLNATFNFVSPSGGETYTKGDIIEISWNASDNIDQVSLSFKREGGTVGNIASLTGLTGSGSYSWNTSNVYLTSNSNLSIQAIAYDTGVGNMMVESSQFTINLGLEAKDAFPDVSTSHSYYDAINYAYKNNIVNGYSDGTFKPDNQVTRGQFTKIIINALFEESEINSCNTSAFTFPDVSSGNVFQKYICVAKQKSIVSGYSDGNYKSDDLITFGQVSKIVSNAYGFTYGNVASDDPLNVFKPYILQLETRKAIPTSVDNSDSFVTRAEFIEIIYRLDSGITNKSSLTFNDVKLTGTTTVSGDWTVLSQGKSTDDAPIAVMEVTPMVNSSTYMVDISFSSNVGRGIYYRQDSSAVYIKVEHVSLDITDQVLSVSNNGIVSSISHEYNATDKTAIYKFTKKTSGREAALSVYFEGENQEFQTATAFISIK